MFHCDRTNVISPIEVSNNLCMQECKWSKKQCSLLLQIYRKYKAEFSCLGEEEQQIVWKKISDEVKEKTSLHCDELMCYNKINELRCEYERLKDHKETKKKLSRIIFMKQAKKAFEISQNLGVPTANVPSSVLLENCKWNNKKRRVLLQAYAKHKSEFSSPDINEQEIWKKIADVVQEKFSSYCNEIECRKKVRDLRCEYERNKNKTETSQRMAVFLDEAKKAFETAENSVTSAEATSNLFAQKFKWNTRKRILLLKIYAKYQMELSCPDVEELGVWQKISNEFKEKRFVNCDELQCQNKVNDLRNEYKRIKSSGVTGIRMAMFMDEAKKVFEPTENAENFFAEESSSLRLRSCRQRNKGYHIALLQVYTKYKKELTSSDVEEQKVWEKIAKEVREKFFYDTGESQSRFQLFLLKNQYEEFKKVAKSDNMPYFFEEAQKAFETT